MRLISNIYFFCERHLVRIWTFCFLLVFLRIPLSSGINVYSFRRTLIVLPVVLSLGLIAIAWLQKKSFRLTFLTKVCLINLILTGLYGLYLVLFVQYGIKLDLLPTLAPVILCLIPPIAIEQFDRDPRDFYVMFERLSLVIIWIGFFWFALQGFSHIDADRLSELLLPLQAQLETYPGSAHYSYRRVGFLLRLEPSALAIAASSVFIYGYFMTKTFSAKLKKYFYLLSAGVGLLAVWYSTSLTLSVATAMILILSTRLYVNRIKIKTVLLAGSALMLALLIIFKGALCSFLPRVFTYMDEYQVQSKKFYVRLGCDFPSFFMRFEPPGTLTNKCVANEMLFFDSLSGYGLIPVFGWYLFTFLSIYMLYWTIRNRRRDMIPLALFAFAFLIPALHMSGVENWGNNYLFILATYFLFQQKNQAKV